MKKYNGFSSESKKCLYCEKVVSDYVKYEVNGLEIQINCHIECFKDIDGIAAKTFRKLKSDIRIDGLMNEK